MTHQAKTAVAPKFFNTRVRLPKQGRQDTLAAKGDRTRVVIKTYAQGGENEMHTHPNEDHVFMVLQGAIEMHMPDGTSRVVKTHEGVLLEGGAYYWFKSCGDKPLVMARIGFHLDPESELFARLAVDGHQMEGGSAENKTVPLILTDQVFGD